MLVKVSKTMTNTIKKELKNRGVSCVSCVELYAFTPENYGRFVGSVWDNETDYNPETGRFSAIVITYNPEEYAVEKFLTTRELNRLFNYSDGTFSGFFDEVAATVAI